MIAAADQGLYFATAATVIPVWFVALGLQTDYFAAGMAVERALRKQMRLEWVQLPRSQRWKARCFAWWIRGGLTVTAVVGMVAEVEALLALSTGRSGGFVRVFVLLAVVLLTMATMTSVIGKAGVRAGTRVAELPRKGEMVGVSILGVMTWVPASWLDEEPASEADDAAGVAVTEMRNDP